MTPEMQSIYDRLRAKIDADKLLIKANPFPTIDRLNRENARLRAMLMNLENASFPDTPETMFSAQNAGRPELKPLDAVSVTREDHDCLVRLRHLLKEYHNWEGSK